MHIQIEGEVIIDAAAAKVWHIVAHEFDNIGRWATAIPESKANTGVSVPNGAEVGGRVCLTSLPGVPDVHETFTYYNGAEMRYGYAATSGLPGFIKRAENNWSVHELGPRQCVVKTRGEVDIKTFPGIILMPFFKAQLNRLGAQTMKELKYFVEQGRPHPRKVKARQKRR